MTQALALLLDAYRDLNARKLFWITLILSGVVIIALAFVGVSGTTISFAGYHADVSPMDPLVLYKWGFSYFVIGIWLTWAAVILALISTAGLFPDLITSGTIDLYLSKPISRIRLFLIKYLSGLLFVTLQVAVFSLGSFILFGVRAHSWNPSLFLAIPIVVCMFSYLFAFLVLLGVWTRSTIAAILLTILLWLGFWGIQSADKQLLTFDVLLKNQIDRNKEFVRASDVELARSTDPQAPLTQSLRIGRQMTADRLPDMEKNYSKLHTAHTIVHAVKTVIPKTGETNDLLDRWLLTDAELQASDDRRSERREARHPDGNSDGPLGIDAETARRSSAQVQGIIRGTSLWYVIGTSLLCEVVVVGFAGWIFCRRDY